MPNTLQVQIVPSLDELVKAEIEVLHDSPYKNDSNLELKFAGYHVNIYIAKPRNLQDA